MYYGETSKVFCAQSYFICKMYAVMVMRKLVQMLPTCVAGQLNIISFYEYEGK